jgi:glycosyltransferase involved in cell wall biosynthesis
VVVVPNGIPAPQGVAASRVAEMRAELGAGRGTVLAVTVALLRPGKGHDDLIAAAATVPSEVRFVLAGEGAEEGRLRRSAAAAGVGERFVFAGFREDVGDLLAAADLVVHPSQADALPTALIHSLAAGRAIVATDVGGIPEIVAGDTGLLVPPHDPEALAAAVTALAGDAARRTAMGERGRRRFTEHFEGGAWAARLRSLYEGLTG